MLKIIIRRVKSNMSIDRSKRNEIAKIFLKKDDIKNKKILRLVRNK